MVTIKRQTPVKPEGPKERKEEKSFGRLLNADHMQYEYILVEGFRRPVASSGFLVTEIMIMTNKNCRLKVLTKLPLDM